MKASEASTERSGAAGAANGKRRRSKPFGGSEYVRRFYAMLDDPTALDRMPACPPEIKEDLCAMLKARFGEKSQD